MSILQSIESTLGGLLEGTFGRLFRSEVRPMEIAHKLAREMDEHRTTSVSRVYAPNEFLVWLSPEDRARWAAVEEDLIDELCAYLLEHARRESLTLASRPTVSFNTDADLRLGEFGIQARLVKLSDDGEPEPPAAGARIDRSPAPVEAPPSGGTMIYSSAERLAAPLAQRQAPTRAVLLVAGRRIEIGPTAVLIGRSSGCDIAIDDPGISRRHAEIRPAAGGFEIHDLGSTNGVYVNRAPIAGSTLLAPGDRIELGATELVFEGS
ncbi:MAG TPA: DUF3662 and FHA domain-containing protein [Solirubrobacteraceae bacterium]|nr:DUF3662 and FHA domain-containing protein [Solirubrobacteraceae bacterium]